MKDLTGRRVKLNRRARRALGREHWDEFGRHKLRGTVLGHPYPGWPEWDVLWDAKHEGGCQLRYSYRRQHLDALP